MGSTVISIREDRVNNFSSVFDTKQNTSEVTLPHSYFPESELSSFAFRSSEVKKLLHDLESYRWVHLIFLPFPTIFQVVHCTTA